MRRIKKLAAGVVAALATTVAVAAAALEKLTPASGACPRGAESIPLPEHPRPDWARPQWVNLNGPWDFGFEKGVYDRKITVPFGWGCDLSGVKNVKGKETGYYRRKVKIPESWKGRRVFLIVGAADYETEFSFDGKVFGHHVGGYTPFEFELTDSVKWVKRWRRARRSRFRWVCRLSRTRSRGKN